MVLHLGGLLLSDTRLMEAQGAMGGGGDAAFHCWVLLSAVRGGTLLKMKWM